MVEKKISEIGAGSLFIQLYLRFTGIRFLKIAKQADMMCRSPTSRLIEPNPVGESTRTCKEPYDAFADDSSVLHSNDYICPVFPKSRSESSSGCETNRRCMLISSFEYYMVAIVTGKSQRMCHKLMMNE